MNVPLSDNFYNEVDTVDDPFLTFLLSTKLSENLNILRTKVISDQLSPGDLQSPQTEIEQFQDDYPTIAFDCLQKQHRMLDLMEGQYKRTQEEIRTKRYSIDFDSVKSENAIDTNPKSGKLKEADLDDSEGGTAELRKRLLGSKAEETNDLDSKKSSERQIEDQENMQNSLIEDMTKLVGSLKQGATAFHNALNEDKAVLSAAEVGVQVASTSLTDISGKLRKYDKKKLGYLFYITVFLFMLVGLTVTFIIIQLFPAL